MHRSNPEKSAAGRGPAPRTDEEALGLLREGVPDPTSFWAPAVEYQLLRKAGAPVAEATARSAADLFSGQGRGPDRSAGSPRRPSPVR